MADEGLREILLPPPFRRIPRGLQRHSQHVMRRIVGGTAADDLSLPGDRIQRVARQPVGVSEVEGDVGIVGTGGNRLLEE